MSRGLSDAGRLTVVLVTCNSAAVLGRCLESIPSDVPIVVVDNASTDGTLDILGDDPRVHVIRNAENLGFGRAANAGVSAVSTEYAFLLNPDVRLDTRTIPVLHDVMEAHPNAAIAAPVQFDEAGQIAHPGQEPLFTGAHRLFKPLLRMKSRRVPAAGARIGPEVRHVGFVSGAAMFLRTCVFADLGGFDERIFLYFEDTDLCLRCVEAGYGVVECGSARILHAGGTSASGSDPVDLLYHMEWSRAYLARKWKQPKPYKFHIWMHRTRLACKAAAYAVLPGSRGKARAYRARLRGFRESTRRRSVEG